MELIPEKTYCVWHYPQNKRLIHGRNDKKPTLSFKHLILQKFLAPFITSLYSARP